MIVYDVTSRESFDAIHAWLAEVEKYAMAGVSKILVGNKVDLQAARQVTYAEGAAVAKKYGIKYLESSAKNSLNVLDVFHAMTQEMINKMNKKSVTPGYGKAGHIGEGKKIMLKTPEARDNEGTTSSGKCC